MKVKVQEQHFLGSVSYYLEKIQKLNTIHDELKKQVDFYMNDLGNSLEILDKIIEEKSDLSS